MHPSAKPWPLFLLAFAAPLVATPLVAAPLQAQVISPTTDALAIAGTVPPAPVVTPAVSIEPEVALDELMRRALANNPQLPLARQSVEAARARVGAARAPGNPTLQIVPRLVGNRGAADEEIILSQPLDVFGKRRARGDVARAQLRAAQSQSVLAERSLIVAVKNSAADLFAAQEAESLGQVQVEVALLFRDAAARRAALGDVPPVQVQRAELELLRVQNEFSNAQAERLMRRATLNQLVGQAPETPLRVALPIAADLTAVLRLRPDMSTHARDANTASRATSPNAIDTQNTTTQNTTTSDAPVVAGASSQIGSDLLSLRSQLLPGVLQRPDMMGAQATLEERQAQVRVLRRERRPDIEIQARRNGVTGRGSTALRAVVVVPLFDFGSNRNERRALEAEVRGQQAQIALLRSQAAMQVEQALLRLRQGRQTIERYRRPATGIVALTLDLLRKTQIGYELGASTYLEVLEAQRTLRQVQTEYLQALVGARTSEAQLESALGATPSADAPGAIVNPSGPSTPPGVAAPGTVPESVIPPNTVEPLNAPGAPPADAAPTISATTSGTTTSGTTTND